MNPFTLSTIIQIINVLFVLYWFAMVIVALIQLRKRKMHATPKALWAIIILCIPILGSIAFFIVKPQNYPEKDSGKYPEEG